MNQSRTKFTGTALFAAALAATALLAHLSGCATKSSGMSYEEARARFDSVGVQPGQPLPALSITNLDGSKASIKQLQGNRPLVLVTASLTCTVAQYHQEAVDDLKRRFGDKISVVVLYTIDAHPQGDPCPYTGEEWAMAENAKKNIVYRQPTKQEERLELARIYRTRFGKDTTLVVDTMDNASWTALGPSPNLGLLVDTAGIVRSREGWFEPEEMEKALATMGITPNIPPAPKQERARS